MRLSRTLAYAIQSTLYLAQQTSGKPVPCAQLARQGGLPERFLLQILRKLVHQGILESSCGVGGGYSLSLPPEQITLRDIFTAFEDQSKPVLPEMQGVSESAMACIEHTLRGVSRSAYAELGKVTLADLLRSENQQQPATGSVIPDPVRTPKRKQPVESND